MKKFSFIFDEALDIAVGTARLLLLSLLGAGIWGSIYLLIFEDGIPMLMSFGGVLFFASGFIIRLQMLFWEEIDKNGVEMKIALAGVIIFAIGFFQMFL